ncbi:MULTISPECIES: NAD(P)H-dependent oxidoreductase [unclassified Streptomyces]|uniref:FMN-dependent NADH-azoreductase n=1 Tax=unclassified Streptomyces TaxID=2593676 RepID=UPI000823B7D1|nr:MULTISPECIES: NAD(P)H-dependent oxidoreductase [unclassified Streptomyces]MYT99973.1 FMN-dependent NADH-azoreductase [Streptomyces sp. SID8350]SCK52453.1 FMN-dependent NADH-azoreductase [Streptomyces sp. AmelKG-D3]
MSYLLHIDASSLSETSVSRKVAQSFRAAWQGPVVHRDLAVSPVPHLSAAGISARITDPAQHTPEQAEAAKLQGELIDEFLGAGAYLFTVPMYNLSMPSVFKAWLDQIMVDGRTLDFANGAPTAGRPAVVVSARGGGYGPGAPNEGRDHLVPTLETILGWSHTLGLDVTSVTPELTMAPDVPAMASLIPLHEASLATAHDQARRLATAIGQ